MTWDPKEHYEQNKDEISKKRRERYKTDPVYRQKRQSKALKYYDTRVKRSIPIDRRTILTEDGTRLMSIGRVARLIGRTIDSIRHYHKDGIIPEPLFFDSRGWRLYTPKQAMLLRGAFRRLDDEEDWRVRTLKDVSRLVTAEWGKTDGEKQEIKREDTAPTVDVPGV